MTDHSQSMNKNLIIYVKFTLRWAWSQKHLILLDIEWLWSDTHYTQ